MAESFNPDAFLAETAPAASSGGFDPDAFLAQTKPAGPKTSALEAGLRGAAQGATFGFADELTGAGEAALDKLRGSDKDFSELYRQHRDESRANYNTAEKEHQGAYLAGNIGGALVPGLLTGGGSLVGEGASLGARVAAGALSGAGQGALYGLGSSKAEDAAGALGDTARGALFGGGIGAAGGAVSSLASKLKGLADTKAGGGLQKAADMAEANQSKLEASARGQAGAETQKASRMVENLLRAESTGQLTPQQQTALEALKNSGRWKELVQGITDANLEDLPSQLESMTGKRQAFQDMAAGHDAAVQAEAARIASPQEALHQVGMRAGRYLPVIGGGLLGKAAGVVSEPGTGFLAGAGIRPALNALKRMAGHPSVVVPAFRGLGKVASIVATEPMKLGRFGPVLSNALQRGDDAFASAHFVLSQNNPDYQKALQALNEGGQ